MADLPSADHIQLFNWEIYDESHPDDGLVWLSSDEAATTLHQTAEPFEIVAVDGHVAEAIVSECSAEDPSVIPVSDSNPTSDIGVRLLLPDSSAGGGSAGFLFGALLPSHKTFGQFSPRSLFRVGALVSVLLIGSLLPSILGHLRPTRVKASAVAAGPSAAPQSAGRPLSAHVRVLTVMAGQQETIREISIRYVGRYDSDVFEEILKLNPDLKDPDQLEDGQLIRIPLRATAPVN